MNSSPLVVGKLLQVVAKLWPIYDPEVILASLHDVCEAVDAMHTVKKEREDA